MPEGPTPLSPQYSFQIWLRNWFPVHYFHPVVFNWLGYKPSKWCNLIPEDSVMSLDQKIFLNIYDSISQYILNQKVKNLWSIYSASHLLIVVLPDHLNNLNNLWIVDLFNQFEVVQRQKGLKIYGNKNTCFSVLFWCLWHFIRIIIWSTIWRR